jgi:hypothetical protein
LSTKDEIEIRERKMTLAVRRDIAHYEGGEVDKINIRMWEIASYISKMPLE